MTEKTISKFARDWRAEHRKGTPAKILADDEVRRFVDARLDRMTFQALAEACRREFGPARAPAATTISNYFNGRVTGTSQRRDKRRSGRGGPSPGPRGS